MSNSTKEYWLDCARMHGTHSAAPHQSHIDPLAVIGSALACGRCGQVAWALVERGDGLILAIGKENIPILDTPPRCWPRPKWGIACMHTPTPGSKGPKP